MAESKTVFIRADAHPNIGMGHVMRCLSIADALKSDGHDIRFILADNGVDGLVKSRGYKAMILGTQYNAMEEELAFWPLRPPDVILVDSYFVTGSYLSELGKRSRVVYIDDRAAFAYPADILVNYNVYGSDLDYAGLYAGCKKRPRFILGPAYVPLRSMFRGAEKKKQPRKVKNVLISTGGSDFRHFALRILRARPTSFTYHILVGALNEDKAEIRRLARSLPNMILHENVIDMKSLISGMDIVVSAAGSTLYEVCACGIPLITYVLADNQMPGAEAFEKLGFAVNCGDLRDEERPAEKLLDAIERLSADYESRVKIGSRMQGAIDGFGADRVAKEIIL